MPLNILLLLAVLFDGSLVLAANVLVTPLAELPRKYFIDPAAPSYNVVWSPTDSIFQKARRFY